ncbi:MAG: hypothetical protein AMK69_11035 [Nitrospira bacterium SG8_3]|nr:MAG: hypothetical protein AMK69_11035 [Nitrospira bacterium SG8_3]
MHVRTKELPDCLQRALDSVSYHRKDVSVEGKTETQINVFSGEGAKAFAIILNLGTGERKTIWGSWGGANMFNPHNQVDLDGSSHKIPINGAVILGSIGHSTWATIVVHPENIQKLLPAPEETTELEKGILSIYQGIISSYRKQELARIGATVEMVDTLVGRKLLKRNKAGSVQITTEGKNAINGYRYR